MMDQGEVLALLAAIASGAILRGTPIAYAAMGESIAQRAGVLNLGVEGMMLVGAMTAFAVQVETGSAVLALSAAGLSAAGLASLHACLVLVFNANQIVSGFATTMIGTGLSAFFGRPYVGRRIVGIEPMNLPVLSDLPVVGRVFFQFDILVYLSLLASFALWILVHRTYFGLSVQAVGQDPKTAFARGIPIKRVRCIATLIGGFFAGIGGAHLSIAYTHVWADSMTAGQGWIAIGLVIVARWNVIGCILIAWLFGAMLVLHPHLQASGVTVSSYLIAMLPFAFAIVALVFVTLIYRRSGYGMPASLAKELSLPNRRF